MALLKLTDVKVTKHVGTNGAFAVEEWITLNDGRTFPKSFTIWATEAPPVDSIVTVTGVFSAKTREYQGNGGMKTAIDISVNDPQVTISGTPAPATAPNVTETPAGPVIIYPESAPF